jgi:ubiquinone/menaquinone biosynthesis C-methylase UbiE
MKKELNHSEVWAIAGGALHDEEYRTKYSEVLAFLLRDKNLKIIDTAGGTGFPTLDLYKLGFTNLSVTDGNETYAKELQEKFKKEGMNIQTLHSSWQEIGTKVSDKYDAIVNADNSFVYMDGWMGGETEEGAENIFKRVQVCLKNFLEILNKDGFAIIGLGKHYVPSYTGTNKQFESEKDGEHFHTDWSAVYDWNKRINTWTVKAESENSKGEFVKKAYLITKEELAEQMKKAGFRRVYVVVPDGTRDDLIVGIK